MPLAIGLFVEAQIVGLEVEDAIVVPRAAVREDTFVLVVDDEDRLRFREVDIFRIDRDSVIIVGGLGAGERVCVSPLEAVTDGMKVRTAGAGEESSSKEFLQVKDNS